MQSQNYWPIAKIARPLLRRASVVLVLILLILGQTIPVSACPSGGLPTWAETCDETELRFDLPKGEVDEGVCGHCGFSASAGPGILPSAHNMAIPGASSFTYLSADQSVAVAAAEQYWAANRGPPEPKENIMNFPTSLFAKDSAEFPLIPWSFPWI